MSRRKKTIEVYKHKAISVLITLVIIVFSHSIHAEVYYVDKHHPQASDNNPGTETEPFETVQKGINTTDARDTVFIKTGSYNMSGFSKNLDQPITILGEDKNLTVLDSIGTLNIIGSSFENMFNMKNIKFTNYYGSIFNLTVPEGDILDGVDISNCIFDKVEHSSKTRLLLGRYDVSPEGIITNINISNCDFMGITAPGVMYIYIYEGIISNVTISNNNFFNTHSISDTRGAVAVYIGNNANIFTTNNILISGNLFDTIIAGTIGEIETHAILAYGENIQIINNTVRYMVPGDDHEAIYMKGSFSVIANNVMINCTSKQGAIAIKGAGKSFSDTIRDNRVQSNQEGKGIYTAGPESITIKDNYYKNTFDNSGSGLVIYAANGTSCSMLDNYSQTAGAAAYMHDVIDGEIIGNTLISYYAETIDINNGSTSNITIDNNIEHNGWPVDSPVAMASSDIVEGEVPLEVNFYSSGSGDPNGEVVSYEWNFHDGSTSTDLNPSHIFTDIRTYAVTLIVTDEDGFKDMHYLLITAGVDEIFVGIDNTNFQNNIIDINVYPNPSASSITIDIEPEKLKEISIYNQYSQRVFNTTTSSGDIDISVLSPGIYIVEIITNEKRFIQKIIKK